MSDIKLAVAQVPSVKGDVSANIAIHLKAIEKAGQLGVSYLVFPELSLIGYEPALAKKLAFSENDHRLQPLIASAIKNNMIIAVGAALRSKGLPRIGLIVISPNACIEYYSKMHLHAGENLFFSAGKKHHHLKVSRLLVANAICADANEKSHAGQCAKLGADAYLLSALISEKGYVKDAKQLEKHAKAFNMLVGMANHNQPTGGWLPIGKSAIWSQDGLLASANETQSALVVAQKLNDIWTAQVIEI